MIWRPFLEFPAGEVEIFLLPHQFLFVRRFVAIATEVKDAMDDNPMELIPLADAIRFRVLNYAFDADKNITADDVGLLGIVERDDIGERMVVEVLLVYGQQVGIGAKYETELARGTTLRFSDCLNPFPNFSLLFRFEISILVKEMYFSHALLLKSLHPS